MPEIKHGDMWSAFDQPGILFLFTANSVVLRNGRLVMGVGMARQVRDRFPNIDMYFGELVKNTGKSAFGLIVPDTFPSFKIGMFQTKVHYRDPARLDVIKAAAERLHLWANAHPATQVHLNYPGIGYGSHPASQIWPLIKDLPSNITIWHR